MVHLTLSLALARFPFMYVKNISMPLMCYSCNLCFHCYAIGGAVQKQTKKIKLRKPGLCSNSPFYPFYLFTSKIAFTHQYQNTGKLPIPSFTIPYIATIVHLKEWKKKECVNWDYARKGCRFCIVCVCCLIIFGNLANFLLQ